ncbi:MAG: hypothetical protein LBL00_08645 [Endomicrobium sp.]|jgi:hypothetical protein|nr:hypothetical protein [Endomicrobium sp.]
MKNVFKVVLLLAFAVSAFAWTGCSKDDKKSSGGGSIIGAWEINIYGDVLKIEYKSDGQFIMYYYTNSVLGAAAKGEFSYTGTELTVATTALWDLSSDINGNKFPDADEFALIPAADIMEEKRSYIVSGNKLTVKDPDTGFEVVYTRT